MTKAITLIGLSLAIALASDSLHADIYTVGASGTGQNCSFPTIQQAIDAADGNEGRDEIWITRDIPGGTEGWPNLRLNIVSDDIVIVGGFDDCWDQEPSGVSILDGGVGPDEPVISISEDSRVEMRHVHVSRSDGASGIRFVGHGNLLLRDSIVSDTDVAGIHMIAQNGNAVVTLERTQILRNFRSGILLDGAGSSSRAIALLKNESFLRTNGTGAHVMDYGQLVQERGSSIDGNRNGGVYVTGGRADISGLVSNNSAADGAGIKVEYDQRVGGGQVRIFNGAVITGNIATGVGGGIYATSIDGVPTEPLVCLRDAELSHNQARSASGGALWVTGEGAHVEWNTNCIPAAQSSCLTAQTPCDVIRANATRPSDDAFTDGPTIRIGRGATADLRGLLIEGNTGTALFAIDSQQLGHGRLLLDTSIVRYNYVGVDAIIWNLLNTGSSYVTNSTILNNFVSSGGVVFRNESGAPMFIENTVVAQPGMQTAAQNSYILTLGPVITLPGTVYPEHQDWFTESVPVFNDDFGRLHWSSPGVDSGGCNVSTLTAADYDGRTRDTDVPNVGDESGQPDSCIRDVGAFEATAPSDQIFRDGFELAP